MDWRVAGGLFAGERGDHAVSFVVAAAAPAIPSTEGKRSMMKLAQRMMSNFCSSIGASTGHRWTTLSGMNDVGVRVTVHKSVDPGQPSGVVLSAATSIRLPVSPESVFSFFRNEQTRSQVLRRSGSPPPPLSSSHRRRPADEALSFPPSVGRPVQRQLGAGSRPHLQRPASGELHLPPPGN